MPRRSAASPLTALVLVTLVSSAQAQPKGAPTPDSTRFNGLTWRSVGPWRGGRVTTVAGVPGKPMVYYMGATGGGVWKTDDAGITWRPIGDGQLKMGSIGSVAVAPDD
ncbi:MAG TPA: hypothetical protein VFU23_00020, partial [Gemmatimonadales bacterium]|nr:hypothetical protein [Gemmatimonadales bacterium]